MQRYRLFYKPFPRSRKVLMVEAEANYPHEILAEILKDKPLAESAGVFVIENQIEGGK